jgi:hypothetical protein
MAEALSGARRCGSMAAHSLLRAAVAKLEAIEVRGSFLDTVVQPLRCTK